MKTKIVIILIGILMISALVAAFGRSSSLLNDELESEDTPGLTAEEQELKNKTFYMYRVRDAVSVGDRTTKEMYNTTYPTGTGNKTELSSFRVLVDWYLYPELAGDLHLDGTSTLSVWARSPEGGDVDMTYELYEVDEDGNEYLVSEGTDSETVQTEWTIHDIPIEIDNYTVSEGSTMQITFDLWGDAAREYEVAYGGYLDDGMRDTNVTFPCMDYLKVEDVHTKNYEGEVTNLFPPEADDTNITIYANITNPFGGYDIRWANLTLEGPDGVILENVSMEKVEGYFDSFKTIYKMTWDHDGQPEGVYDVTVRTIDRNGKLAYNRTGEFQGHDEYGYHSFVIGGLDHYVNIQVSDDHGEILENTTINLKVSDEVVFNTTMTDNEGIANFTVANATYIITVIWQDVEVSTNRTLDVGEVGNRTRDDPFEVTAGIFYPGFIIKDMEGEVVDNANVYLTHPNGSTRVDPYVTDDDGYFSLDRTAEGRYELDIEWKGRDVGEFSIDVSTSDDFEVNVLVYHLQVQVQDRSGGSVSNALFVGSYDDTRIVSDSGLTDGEGVFTTRLPATGYFFEIYWNDAKVYEETYELSESSEIVLTADIFQVSVTVYDSLEDPLEGAEVTATYTETEREIDTDTTDSDGLVTFQLADGEHRFDVTWIGVNVASELRVVSETQTDFEIEASVYQLNIIALDSTVDEETLPDARISVRIDGNLVDTGNTDEDGVYISKLPATDVDIEVEWKGIQVRSIDGYPVEGNDDLQIKNCDVYYLDLTVIDSRDTPVQGVSIDVEYQDSLIESGTSDSDGGLRLRLPVESYTIKAEWYGVEVDSREYSMVHEQGENELTIDSDIYYLTMNVTDAEEEILPGTRAEIYLDDSLLFSEVTDHTGTLTIRLPSEEYDIYLEWRDFDVGQTDIQLEDDLELTISTSVYWVDVTPLDSRDETLTDAEVNFVHRGNLFETKRIPENGTVALRLPHEEFDISVEWDGIEVYNVTHAISESSEMNLDCDVYYLHLTGEDSRGENVEDLVVSVYHEGLPEGQDLLTTISIDDEPEIRLPYGVIRLEAEWRGFYIADQTVEVNDDTEFSIQCEIYYIDVEVVDSEGEYLDGADLIITDEDGVPFHTEVTDIGAATPKLPIGEWTLDAYWRGQKVGSVDTELTGDKEISLETMVHYLEVVIEGQDGPVIGSEVTLIDSEGTPIETLETDGNGTVEFKQIVYGDYTVSTRLRKTQHLTEIDLQETEDVSLDSSQQIQMTFEGYPRPIYKTNLFYIVMAIVGICVVGGIIIAKKKEVF